MMVLWQIYTLPHYLAFAFYWIFHPSSSPSYSSYFFSSLAGYLHLLKNHNKLREKKGEITVIKEEDVNTATKFDSVIPPQQNFKNVQGLQRSNKKCDRARKSRRICYYEETRNFTHITDIEFSLFKTISIEYAQNHNLSLFS